MVQMLHRRKSSTAKSFLIHHAKNFSDGEQESKNNQSSPSQTKKMSVPSSSPFELRKLLRKKSSKEKDKLLVVHDKHVNSDQESKFSTEFVKTVTPKLKSKSTTKGFKNEKLFNAVTEDDFQLTRKLIFVEGYNLNELSPDGNTVLHIAAASGHLNCMNMLLECGAKVNIKDAFNKTALEYAVIYGNFECASSLIEYGADISSIKDGM